MVTKFLPLSVMEMFFEHSGAANSAVRDWIWQKVELIQALIVVLITCKNGEDPNNQKTNGPVYTHLISGPTISTRQVLPNLTLL